MAVTYGFYNALNHDRLYDAIQMSSIFDGIIRDGIFSTIGDTMIVTSPEDGMYVNVGSGRAWFNHTWTLNDTAYPIEAEEAEVVLDRIDAVILEVNSSAEVRANSIKFLKGTPSSNPVKPTLTHNAEVNQYALAYVRIRAGQTTIFQSDIENAIGTDETPFITGVLQQVSIETLLKQWEAEFNTYFTNFQNTSTTEFNNWLATKVSEYTAWFAQMQTDMDSNFNEFDAWFQRMKDQLSEDAAGHLQAQIDALSEAAKKGSIVTVTTTDPTLFGKNVTISKTGFDPVTSSFNSTGVAYFETVPMVGDVTIEATNGTLTAHGSLNIPYFGLYNTTLEFWEAILDISTIIETLYNRQINIKKNNSTVGTTTFDSTGHATFSVHSVGTYNVSATDSLSTTYEVDVDVTEETTYIVEFIDAIDGATVEPTDDITTWLKCANIEDPSITTLADVLANRSLFETLIANSNACNYMARSTTWALAEGLVPTMTSDTEPSGTVSSNSTAGSMQEPYRAFDGDTTTYWTTANNVGNGSWLRYQFPEAKCIKAITINTRFVSSLQMLRSYKIQGSNDATTWVDLLEDSLDNKDYGKILRTFDNSNSYLYYQLLATSDSYFISSTFPHGNISLMELQFYEDVDIVKDQDAMSLIGKYDYCSNALLSNATWAEAIGNSEYFEEVLNVKVPKMTSNTAPAGEVVTNGTTLTNYSPYMAFDGGAGDLTNRWVCSEATNVYIGYDFKHDIVVKKASVQTAATTVNGIKEFKIQGSVDGVDWIDLTEVLTHTSNSAYVQYVDVNSDTAYRYYCVYILSSQNGTNSVSVDEIQFYGRASAQTNIIHSAANDTIYMMKDGSPLVLTTTDSNGVGTLDFTQFDDGVTYTLYSSVAKDPNNLSNDYSKNIRITKNKYGCTTEAYLMPDAVIYWYGYSPYDSTITTYATINSAEASSGGYAGLAPTINRNVNNLESVLTGSAKGGAWIFNTLLPFTKYTNLKVITKDYTIDASSYAIPQTIANPPTEGYSGGKSIFKPVSNTLFTVATSSLSNYIGVHLHTFNSALISFSALWLE